MWWWKIVFFWNGWPKNSWQVFPEGTLFWQLFGHLMANFGTFLRGQPTVRKGAPAPLFKAPTPWPSLPSPFLKPLCPLPSVLLHPLLRYFRQFPHPHANPSSPSPTNQLSWFKLSKGQIYQFNCCLLSKINFNLLNPFTSRLS